MTDSTPRPGFLSKILKSPVVFDGAMGTVLYEQGCFMH